jgi:transcription antitermination protein NusB
MGIRRQARELAMQALFSMDMSNAFSGEMFEDYCGCFPPGKRFYPFFEYLVKGVLENKTLIDQVIERYSSNWKIRRMACVDRNILRIGVFEILFSADIPVKVSINEAIDIGKRFGTPESGAFINGILDSIRLALESGQLEKAPPSAVRPAPQDVDDE